MILENDQITALQYTLTWSGGDDEEGNCSYSYWRKTAERYSGENPHDQAGTDNPIHIVPPAGIEPGSQRWKARKEPLHQPDCPIGSGLV